MLKECNLEADEVLRKMKKEYKKNFPYLSGNKILPLWIRMLHDVISIDMENMNRIPIPIDVHIARATLTTGGMTGSYSGTVSSLKNKIQKVWKEACAGKKYYPLQFDEALWTLSKHGCSFRAGDTCSKKPDCPVGEYCVNKKIRVSQETVQLGSKETPSLVNWSKDKRKSKKESSNFKYNVTYAGSGGNERGIVMLDSPGTEKRDRLPDKGEWNKLIVEGETHWMKPAKIALNVVKENRGGEENVLDDILRDWFGEEGILPGGKTHHVSIDPVEMGDEKEVFKMEPYSKGIKKEAKESPKNSDVIEPFEIPSGYSVNPEDVLPLIPCCSKKDGSREFFEEELKVSNFIGSKSTSILEKGRKLCSEDIQEKTEPKPALTRYNGNLYDCVPDFKQIVAKVIEENGLHLLIVSASYGLVRPEEAIKKYDKTMSKRKSAWSERIPKILSDYIQRNSITHLYGFLGKTTPYMDVVKKLDSNKTNLRTGRLYYPTNYIGAPLQTVPKLSGRGMLSLIKSGFDVSSMKTQFNKGELKYYRID